MSADGPYKCVSCSVRWNGQFFGPQSLVEQIALKKQLGVSFWYTSPDTDEIDI